MYETCDPNTLWFKAKIDNNFANFFLKTEVNNKLAKSSCTALQTGISELAVKSMPKALRHFKVDTVLKIDETFYKQAEFMWM